MASSEVTIVVRAKNEASKAFNDVLKDVGRMKATAGDAFGAMQRVGKTAFLGIAAGAGAGALALLKFTKAAASEQANIARLTTAIKTLDTTQQQQAKGVEGLIKQREKLAFADDQLRDSLSLLIAQTGSYEEATRRQAIAMDLARGTGLDLQLASKLVGKVTEENVEVLKRYGITIGEGATETEALAEIQRRFSGQSAAYAKTAQGQWERVTNEFQNMQETIGAALLPVITRLGTALADFLARHEGTFQRIGNAIAEASAKIGEAADTIFKKLKPAFDFLDKGDRVAIIAALAAVIAGPLVAAVIAFGIASAIAFATNPVTQFALAIGLITIAITLMVRHWDQIWAGMKQAPAAVMDFIKKNFVDILIGFFVPGGPLILLIKNWNKIFDAMPVPVQKAMNTVAGFIEDMVNKAIFLFNKLIGGVNALIDGLNKLPNAIQGADIPKISTLGDVDLTRRRSDQAIGGRRVGRLGADDDIARGFSEVERAAEAALPALDAYAGSGGGGIGGTGAAAEEAVNELADLMLAFQRWNQLTGESLESFVARLELQQRERELDQQIADAMFRVQVEQAKATDGATQFRIALKELALEALRSGRTITEVLRDTWQKIVDDIESAFNSLFSKPTREQAELRLQIALLEEEKARKLAAGATEDEVDGINNQIDALRKQQNVMSAHEDVLKAQLDVANQTLLTEEQRNFAAALYIIAMNTESTKLGQLSAQADLEAFARQHLINSMFNAAEQYNNTAGVDSNRAFFDSLPDQARNDLARLLEELARQGRLHSGTNYVPRTGNYLLEQGEAVIPARENKRGWQDDSGSSYAGATINVTLPNVRNAQDFPKELDRYMRGF